MAAPITQPIVPCEDLLKAVSRSFYLSLRFLPTVLRQELSGAYLLARASDTIADTAKVSAETRLALLQQFHHCATSTNTPFYDAVELVHASANLADRVESPSEAQLLRSLGQLFHWTATLPPEIRCQISRVLEAILRGQMLDLQRFGTGKQVRALSSAADLEDYTYLVAGCVGEFWTEMIALKLPGHLRITVEEMRLLGRRFGQGLQLVNILRDLSGDLASGRCYLPLNELKAAGFDGDFQRWQAQTSSLLAVRCHWLDIARQHLNCAHRYGDCLHSWRLKFTARLPHALALETLNLVAQSPSSLTARVKVPRCRVYWLMLVEGIRSLFG